MTTQKITKLANAFRSVEVDSYEFNDQNDYVEIKINPTVSVRDTHILISGEGNQDIADWYGEAHGGYPWICEELEALAEKLGVIIEWQDAGTLSVYPE